MEHLVYGRARTHRRARVIPVCAMVAAGAMAPAAPAWAQTIGAAERPAGPALADDASKGQLEEIVVTAQKRSENLQDVPIAVTAVTGKTIESLNIKSARDLPNLVPGLVYSQAGGTTQTFLRGIGTTITQVNADPSVATYIDGVYISLSTVTSVKLSDIASVEVLRGPQGTLYGRNATGGAVSITTKLPTKDFAASVNASLGNFQRGEGGISISGALADHLYAGVYADYDRRKPYSKLQNGPGFATPDVRDHDFQWSARGKLVYDSDAGVRIVASADITKYGAYQDLAYRQLQADAEGYGTTTIGPRATANTGKYSASANGLVDNNWTTKGVSLRSEIDLGFARLVELSAYRDSRSYTNADGDATEAAVAATVVSLDQRSKQTTHELQLVSNKSKQFQWIFGAFFYDDKGRLDPFHIQGPPFDQFIRAGANTRSYAAFGQLAWRPFSDFGVTLGGRYTDEKKRYTGGTLVQIPAPPAARSFAPRDQSYHEFTPKIGVDYHIGRTMLYANYTKGFKSGVFNLNGASDVAIGPVAPEHLDAYEVGSKSEFFDRAVRFNTSFFHYDYKNLQVQTINSAGISSLQNAAKAHSNGFDIDAAWAATPVLELRMNAEYLDAKYDSFPAFQGKRDRNANTPGGSTRGGNMDVPGGVNVSGYQTARSPKFSGSVGASYTTGLSGGGKIVWTGNLFHTAGYPFNPDNTVSQHAYSTLTLSAELTPANNEWSISLWANNVTNTYYYAYKQINNQGTYGIPAAPRTYGLSARYNFGG